MSRHNNINKAEDKYNSLYAVLKLDAVHSL